MSTKHTPGPWEAVGNLVRSSMATPAGVPRGLQIAECRDSYFLPHSDEAKANARLIAAAPELIAFAIRQIKRKHRGQVLLDIEDVIDLENLISRATGEAAS